VPSFMDVYDIAGGMAIDDIAHACYNLINASGATVAVTSEPTGRNNNFTITDN